MRKFEKISKEQFMKDYKSKANIYIPPDFEDVRKGVENDFTSTVYKTIVLPKRATGFSAGYDFYSTITATIKPNETLTIPTGIKAYMNDNEVLKVYPRSSLGFKYQIQLVNTVGIIDKDYVDNPNNEGHIFIKLVNRGSVPVDINIGDGIAQGIFESYLITDDDNSTNKRIGGIGSTDKETIINYNL